MQHKWHSLLGMTLTEVEMHHELAAYLADGILELIGDRFHLQVPSRGIEVVADRDTCVSTVFFYSGRQEFSGRYVDALPNGISFTDSRNRVLQLLGQPNDTGGGDVFEFLGDVPQWDRFDYHSHSLHIQYSEDQNAVALVSIMRSDAVPGPFMQTE